MFVFYSTSVKPNVISCQLDLRWNGIEHIKPKAQR